jgi:excalibur calcium-binding domain-containing protein
MKRLTTATAIAALAIASTATPATAFRDRDCSDFSSWRAAQKFYRQHGGPRRDPHRLDADHDGIACESLR